MSGKNKKKGSVTVELSIFIVCICGLSFGFMAIMNGIKTSITLQVAAREGSREYAVTGKADLGLVKAKEQLTLGGLNLTSVTIVPKEDDKYREMTVTQQYKYTIPLFGTYTKTLKGYCTFYVEPIDY